MPAISLVICVCNERELLQRLLQKAVGCYDDLVVVHDGAEGMPRVNAIPEKQPAINYSELKSDAPLPDGYRETRNPPRAGTIHELVESHGGRYYEGPRALQQEPHWPFAWWRARHDWILRWDADEFPSDEMRAWLQKFRQSPEPPPDISGYTCIWPLWSGKRVVTRRWPDGRIFFINRQRVKFFGMVEQVPVPDIGYEALQLVLHHEPRRKSYGIRNILFRQQAYRWRRVIARSLMGPPTALPCWRWSAGVWPLVWEDIRRKPLRTAFRRLLLGPIWQAREMWQAEHKIVPTALLGTGAHQFLMAITFFFFRCRHFRRLASQ